MKIFKSSLLIMLTALSLFACNAQTSENQTSDIVLSEDIHVYYFHNTKRCATCNAVENSLNLEEDEGKDMAQALHVSGQTLVIVQGENHVNLTNEGFMNARTNPTKFHEIVKTQIDKLL